MATSGEWGGDEGRGVTVIGVGGAGSNAVAAMSRYSCHGLRVLCADTDQRALNGVEAPHRLQLGRQLTGGLGTGADHDMGRRAAEEAMPAILEMLKGTGLCIIAAGLGGGTGTGAAPAIAAAARACGAVVIGIAIKPFRFEGTRRARNAEQGAGVFAEQADAMVTVCNEHLFRIAGADMTMRDALAASNALVCESASGFARLVSEVALKRVGLADLRALLATGGKSVIGYGEHGEGADRALHAARSALCNPLLETAMQSAGRLLVTISGGDDLGLYEVDAAIAWLSDHVEPGADIIWGATTDATLGGRVRIGIAATRLTAPSALPVVVEQPAPPQPVSAPRAAVMRASAPVPAPPPMELAAATARHRTAVVEAMRPAPVMRTSAPIPAPPPMELAAATARHRAAADEAMRPAPVMAVATPAVATPAPVRAPISELVSERIAESVPEPVFEPASDPVAEPLEAFVSAAPTPARGELVLLDGDYLVRDSFLRLAVTPPPSLVDRIHGALTIRARSVRRAAFTAIAA